MDTKKQSTTREGTTARVKYVANARDIIPPSGLSPIVKVIVFAPSQGATGDIHQPSTYKAQLLQIFDGMTEELAK